MKKENIVLSKNDLNIIITFTEPPNLHWFDVHESYFNAFCQHLGGSYRAPEGKIYQYDEVKESALY